MGWLFSESDWNFFFYKSLRTIGKDLGFIYMFRQSISLVRCAHFALIRGLDRVPSEITNAGPHFHYRTPIVLCIGTLSLLTFAPEYGRAQGRKNVDGRDVRNMSSDL